MPQGSFPVVIEHGQKTFEEEIVIDRPNLWWPDAPHLYKVQIILKDQFGDDQSGDDSEVIDDFVVTTGIRTVDQEGGRFRLNGEVYMLNGSQIFGSRSPIEETMKWIFCPPAHWYVRELLQIKNMNSNMLRIHVHAFYHPPGNTNDPRLPEIADQMGVMLMWATPAWVRTGMGWGHIDWELVKGKPWYRLHSYEWSYDEGTIGRRLTLDEWQESQTWQAFSSWESMKKQRQLDYDGFSWCNLHGGPNSVTYKKPLIDFHGHAKLAYWTNKMVYQKTVAGSADVNVVYGPEDLVKPVIINLPVINHEARISCLCTQAARNQLFYSCF